MIVTEAAGSASDLAARMICERLSRALGQPVRVENRVGDDGAQAAAGARPDGATWLFAPSSVLSWMNTRRSVTWPRMTCSSVTLPALWVVNRRIVPVVESTIGTGLPTVLGPSSATI